MSGKPCRLPWGWGVPRRQDSGGWCRGRDGAQAEHPLPARWWGEGPSPQPSDGKTDPLECFRNGLRGSPAAERCGELCGGDIEAFLLILLELPQTGASHELGLWLHLGLTVCPQLITRTGDVPTQSIAQELPHPRGWDGNLLTPHPPSCPTRGQGSQAFGRTPYALERSPEKEGRVLSGREGPQRSRQNTRRPGGFSLHLRNAVSPQRDCGDEMMVTRTHICISIPSPSAVSE